jgi:hypothetical protein
LDPKRHLNLRYAGNQTILEDQAEHDETGIFVSVKEGINLLGTALDE